MGEAVLVFPAGMPEGLAFRDRAKARGLRVVGASSVEHDPAESAYEAWEHLPYVNDPGFDEAFGRRWCGATASAPSTRPHYIVWKHLSERLGQIAPGAQPDHGQIATGQRARLPGAARACRRRSGALLLAGAAGQAAADRRCNRRG